MKKQSSEKKTGIKIIDIVLIGLMVALLEGVKFALSFIPGVEIVTLLIVIYTRFFKKKIFFLIPVFLVTEFLLWGFGPWSVMYIYIWTLLALFAYIFREQKSVVFWAVFTGTFGLIFGFLCSFVYLFMGGPSMMFSWWISGLPVDFLHCISNVVLTLVLFKPLDLIFSIIRKAVLN